MNKSTISKMILFAMGRLTGDAAWCVAGTAGKALACLELGRENEARREYGYARQYLRTMIRLGSYLPQQ